MNGELGAIAGTEVVVRGDNGGRSAPPAGLVGPVGVGLLMAYLMGSCLLLLYGMVQLWPEPSPAGGTPPDYSDVGFFFWTFRVSTEVRLFLLVALTGALGGLVHTLRSFYWYIGNHHLMRQWLPMYLLLPFVGSGLALIFYLVIRGGFFSPQATVQQTSPFGFIALAGLIGMFSPQAVLKLQQVAETVLAKPEPGSDARPQGLGTEAGAPRPYQGPGRDLAPTPNGAESGVRTRTPRRPRLATARGPEVPPGGTEHTP